MAVALIIYIVSYVVFGLILGFLCSYIAGAKNRSRTGFFFLGFFLGVIGIIVAAAVPKLAADSTTPVQKMAEGPFNTSYSQPIPSWILRGESETGVQPHQLHYMEPRVNKVFKYVLRHKESPDKAFIPSFEKSVPKLPSIYANQKWAGGEKTNNIYAATTDTEFLVVMEDGIVFKNKLVNITKVTSSDGTADKNEPGETHMDELQGTGVAFLEIVSREGKDDEICFIFNYGKAEEVFTNQAINEDMRALNNMIAKAKGTPVIDSPKENPPEKVAPIIGNDTKKCPFCAEIVKAEAIKCKHCGSTLEAGRKTNPGLINDREVGHGQQRS